MPGMSFNVPPTEIILEFCGSGAWWSFLQLSLLQLPHEHLLFRARTASSSSKVEDEANNLNESLLVMGMRMRTSSASWQAGGWPSMPGEYDEMMAG